MQKSEMRAWLIALEGMLDNKLKKWDKQRKWENGEAVHLMWQWEQTIIKMDVFWEDKKEVVRLKYISPRVDHDFMWDGLTDKTFNKIQDRVGNLAMATMHPVIDPLD
jgi:hypothetical protein